MKTTIKLNLENKYYVTIILTFMLLHLEIISSDTNVFIAERETRHIDNCLQSILSHSIKPEEILLICMDPSQASFLKNSHFGAFLNMYHSNINHTVLISHLKDQKLDRHMKEKGNYFLIFLHGTVQNHNDIYLKPIQVFDQTYTWDSKARFIVVVVEPVPAKDELKVVQRTVEELWKKYMLNFIVLILSHKPQSTSLSIKIYTWFPFSKSTKCGTDFGTAYVIDKCIEQKGYNIRGETELFPEKVPNKFNGCKITGSTFEYEPYIIAKESDDERGLEIELLHAVADSSGLQVRLMEPTHSDTSLSGWGGSLANGTWVGSLGDVVNKKADLAFCGLKPSDSRWNVMDMTVPHVRDGWFWYVPRAKLIPNWKALVVIFNSQIWTLVFVSCVLASITWILLNPNESIINSGFKFCFNLIGVSLLNYLPELPTLRLFFALWLYYCLFINSAYQSFLVSVLTHPGHEKQVTNLEELVNSTLHFGSDKYFRMFFQDGNDFVTKKIKHNFEACNSLEDCEERAINDEDFAIFSPRPNMIKTLIRLRNMTMNEKVFVPLGSGGLRYDVTMYLRRNSPYTDRFNTVFTRIRQSGILSKWWQGVNIEESFGDIKKREYIERKQHVVFTVSHLQGAFAILVFGICISAIAFMMEITICQRCLRQRSALESN